MGLVPLLSWWRYDIYPGHIGPISLSLSLFSLTHDPGLPEVSRQDGGEGLGSPSCVLEVERRLSLVAFLPTVQGVEGIGSSLALPPLLPGHCRHWNGPECTWPLLLFSGKSSTGEVAGPLPKASGP